MLGIGKILAPVAFSEECRGAVRQAAMLACRFGSKLTLVHVLEPVTYAFSGWEAPFQVADLTQQREADTRQRLDSFFTAELGGAAAEKVILEGDPATEIVSLAHGEKMDLIVMPTRGYGPFRRMLLGSVTAKVLHDASCPVWTGVHMEEAVGAEQAPIRRVACAVDLGPQTRAALGWAAGMAQAWAADLTILHALTVDPESESRQALTELARDQISEHQRALGTQAEVYIEFGRLPDAVTLPAGRIAADLLVIGRGHGSGAAGRLPTHAYTIIRESPCPVVSV
ncbi:MAG: universal stress protein [Acidobacteria bacterium]|nr:universal stress protein [Acidobacteriota bacterium]